MRYIFLLIVLALAMGEVGAADAAALKVAVDFEERPVPNLARISNIYRGDADYLYAFLVISGAETQAEEMYVAAYDIGYRLISPDMSAPVLKVP